MNIRAPRLSRGDRVFDDATNSMNHFHIQSIGFMLVKGIFVLIHLRYNMCCYE